MCWGRPLFDFGDHLMLCGKTEHESIDYQIAAANLSLKEETKSYSMEERRLDGWWFSNYRLYCYGVRDFQ